MNRLIHILAVLSTAAILLIFAGGCQPIAIHALGSIAATGSEAEKAGAYIASATAAVQAAKSHVDPVGKSALELAQQANAAAAASVKNVGAALGKVQKDYNDLQGQVDPLKNRITQITSSKWYKLGQFLNWCFWAVITLTVIHYVCIAIKIIILWISPVNPVAMMIAKICGWIAKWVNPPAWGIALLAWFEEWHAAKTAITNTASLPPDTITAPPTPAQIKVLKKPRAKGDPPLVRQLNATPPVIGSTVPPVV